MQPLATHSEREWILIGAAESCADRGREATGVDEICAAAGVTRESFEQVFADRDECLGAAMETVVEEAWRALDGALSPARPWGETLGNGVAALLGALAARPAFAHLALIEAPTAGGRAQVLYESSKAALLGFLERGREQPGVAADVPASGARGALAGAETLAVGHVLAGKTERLGELAPDLVYMLAVPFLGVSEAQRLAFAQSPKKRASLRAVA